MNKSTFFTGQPIFTQLIKLIPKNKFDKVVRELTGDAYYKKFKTWDHLITLLYACYQHCESIREIISGMRACEGRLYNLGVHHFPCRSTLSDANKNRSHMIFEALFGAIYEHLHQY